MVILNFYTTAVALVFLWSPFAKLHPDFHSMGILECYSKVVVTL